MTISSIEGDIYKLEASSKVPKLKSTRSVVLIDKCFKFGGELIMVHQYIQNLGTRFQYIQNFLIQGENSHQINQMETNKNQLLNVLNEGILSTP